MGFVKNIIEYIKREARGNNYNYSPPGIDSFWENKAKKIIIDLDPTLVTFYCNNKHLQLAPYIHLKKNLNNKYIVADVGKDVDIPDCIKINIFNDPDDLKINSKMVDIYEVLLRYAFSRLLHKRAMLRPIAIFKNIDRLQDYCHGNQEAILREAAERSGAMLVFFE